MTTTNLNLIAVFILITALVLLAIALRQIDAYRKRYGGLTPVKKKFGIASTFEYGFAKIYTVMARIPFMRRYLFQFRRRASITVNYSERGVMAVSARMAVTGLFVSIIAFAILLKMDMSLYSLLTAVIVIVIAHSLILDIFVNSLDTKLLKETADFISELRHNFHVHGMVDEAFYDAVPKLKQYIRPQAETIHAALTSADPAYSLEEYYAAAPNQYLKLLAGLSYFAKEYGDTKVNGVSVYLTSLSYLSKEIHIELLKRSKLAFALSGLPFVTLMPLVLMKPLENWAAGSFPGMARYYAGTAGLITKALLLVVVCVSFVLIKKLQSNARRQQETTLWERFCRVSVIKNVIRKLAPKKDTPSYNKTIHLLREAGSTEMFGTFYFKRFVIAAVCFAVVIFGGFYAAAHNKNLIINEQTITDASAFGAPSTEDTAANALQISNDKVIIKIYKNKNLSDAITLQAMTAQVAELQGTPVNSKATNDSVMRVRSKIQKINAQYFKYYYLIIAALVSVAGFFAPYGLLLFQKRMREKEMQNEVTLYQSIVLMIMNNRNISVLTVLEWLESFSNVFKQGLSDAVISFSRGGNAALEELKNAYPHTDFVRFIEKLQLAEEKLSLKEAFDELEAERVQIQDERKEENEKQIQKKEALGRIIGFAPLYALIGLYLVAPMMYVSYTQLMDFMKQLGKM